VSVNGIHGRIKDRCK